MGGQKQENEKQTTENMGGLGRCCPTPPTSAGEVFDRSVLWSQDMKEITFPRGTLVSD